MVAPALTGMLAAKFGNYDLGLWIAGGFVVVAVVLVLWLKFTDQTAQELDASAKLASSK